MKKTVDCSKRITEWVSMIDSKFKSKQMDSLFEAVLSLKSKDDCYRFFDDICTINELLSIAQRYEVARLLYEKETYNTIMKKTGASTATISRVNRCLNYGAGGYRIVLERAMKKKD
ncbi:MAG: YerC/YecD family TrpR-related protein [Christensenellales bacterium]